MHFRDHLKPHRMDAWFILLIGLISVNQSLGFLLSRDLPCRFLDSVNITDGTQQDDGSILFRGTRIPRNQYAKINYIFENGTKHVQVDPYTRGCLCNIKPCIRLCCPFGTFVDSSIQQGKKCREHEAAKEFESDIVDANNNANKMVLDYHFAFVDDRPCSKFYLAETYNITHSGHVLHENTSVAHQKYCMRAMLNEDTKKPSLDILMCYESQDLPETRYSILPYGMLLSVPFIVATFLVYIWLPELRNLHGKCLLCYLFGLVIGYTAMALVQLNGSNYVEPVLCKSVGYTIYLSFMSAFLWLSVISFDLWWNFRNTTAFIMFSENKRFFLYMLYAWGLSSFLTFIVFVLDSTKSLSEELQPGIGSQTCFLKRTVLSQFLFFYMPLCVICCINILFFVMTALKIRQVQQEIKRVTSQGESSTTQNKLNHDKDNVRLFFRLFIVMGVNWSMEIISFLVSPQSNFFLLTDICNSIQGVLIFVLFVMKRRVLRLIKKRWQVCFGRSITNGSLATNSTSATYATPNIAMNQITTSKAKTKGNF